ncbi:hypothetical protein JW879_02015 [candidate division WOR-3 bacterium]|nr:hypothetical protein [candidate division WOR-3 bacterium]
MTIQKYFISFLLIALFVLFANSCNRNSNEGIVIGVGITPSLDESAGKIFGGKISYWGIPIMAVRLNEGTKITAICSEKSCSDIVIGQEINLKPIKGSYYWQITSIVNSMPKVKRMDKKIIPLQHNISSGLGKVINDHGFNCNGVKYGEFHDKAAYVRIDYSGPIEYCITCNDGQNYKLLQSSDNSFQVFPCEDADCEICTKESGTVNQTKPSPKSLEEYIREGTELANFKGRDDARQKFLEAIRQYPEEAKAHYVFGNFLFNFYGRETEGLDLAESELRIAIKLDPNFTPSYYDLGRVLSAKGLEKEAEEAFLQYESLQKGE